MDMHMPVMDGLEAAAKIFELNTGVPIVAMTANVMANDRDIYKDSGMHDCVGKPFTSQELWRCLSKYLQPVKNSDVSEDDEHHNAMPELDSDFQISLKKLFARNNAKKYLEIADALDMGDVKLAHRLVHTLKSNAGQIGMASLQNAAGDIETQLKNGKIAVDPQLLELLKNELETALLQIEPMLQEKNKTGAQKFLEPQKALELLEELEVMLKSGNTECEKLIGALRAVEGSGSLIQQIEDFNFDSGAAILAGLKKNLMEKLK